MAKQTVVQLTDDLDGSVAVESVTFALRGQHFEIDLNEKHVAALERALSKYIAAGRKPTRPAVARRAVRGGRRLKKAVDIREWARANGYEIAARGRVPRAVQEAYAAAVA